MCCDNLSIVTFAYNLVLYARTKHIELDLNFLREIAMKRKLEVRHLPSQDQIVDVLTKAIYTFQLFNIKIQTQSWRS